MVNRLHFVRVKVRDKPTKSYLIDPNMREKLTPSSLVVVESNNYTIKIGHVVSTPQTCDSLAVSNLDGYVVQPILRDKVRMLRDKIGDLKRTHNDVVRFTRKVDNLDPYELHALLRELKEQENNICSTFNTKK